MEKEYYTIKEYADLKGVSYHAIYKKLNTTLKPFVTEVKGHKVLKKEALEGFSEPQNFTVKENLFNGKEKGLNSSASTVEDELRRINARNEDLIDDLRSEIKSKDKQIEEMSLKIANLFETHQRLVERNQQLQMNYQLLLGNTTEQVNAEENAEGARSKDEGIEETRKQGFISKLFKLK